MFEMGLKWHLLTLTRRTTFRGSESVEFAIERELWWSKQFVLIFPAFYLLLRRPTNICYSHVL